MFYFGFPFETLSSAAVRRAYMADALRFMSQPFHLEIAGLDPEGRLRLQLQGEPGLTYVIQRAVSGGSWAHLASVLNTSGTTAFTDTWLPETTVLYRASLAP